MHGASCVWVRPRDMLHMVHIDTGRVMFTWVKESPRHEVASKTTYLSCVRKKHYHAHGQFCMLFGHREFKDTHTEANIAL